MAKIFGGLTGKAEKALRDREKNVDEAVDDASKGNGNGSNGSSNKKDEHDSRTKKVLKSGRNKD